jgi:hypothetical protein
MNRTLEDATVKRPTYKSHEQLRTHLQLFLEAYQPRSNAQELRDLTPYEEVLQVCRSSDRCETGLLGP